MNGITALMKEVYENIVNRGVYKLVSKQEPKVESSNTLI